MDFGCGVGRLTQALCDKFDQVTGVDISSSMIERARSYNRHGEACRYRVNTAPDLSLFDDAVFDFVYTDKVLQHIPPEVSERYIAEFFRILKPGGMALFQIPSGKRYKPGGLGEAWYKLRKGPLRRFWKRLRGKQAVEMHHIHVSRVEEIIAAAGGELVNARQFGSVRRNRESYFYCALRR
jgi:ubiquinone/menaquinone biosynthesis C-methylase UbiE